MTAPASEPSFGSLWSELSTLPRWALIGIVGGAGILAWYLFKGSATTATPTNSVWGNQATSYLTQRGYSRAQSQQAVAAYSTGQQLTPAQVSLVSEAVSAVGTPDMPINTTPVVPSGSPISTPATAAAGDGYYYVTSLGIGWTSTFRGIAQQFYGDPSDSSIISAMNPGVTPSDFSLIPAGTVITLPRSLTS